MTSSISARPSAIRVCASRSRQAEELAFAGGHEPRAQAVGGALMRRVVAVEKAVEEHLDALRRPSAEAASRTATRGRSAHRPNGWARRASPGGRRHAGAVGRAAGRPRFRSAAKHRGSRRAGGGRGGQSWPLYVRRRQRRRQSINKASLEVHRPRTVSTAADADRRRKRFLRALRRRRADLCRGQAAGGPALRP